MSNFREIGRLDTGPERLSEQTVYLSELQLFLTRV